MILQACFPTDPSQEPIVLKGRIAKSGLSGNAKYVLISDTF